MIGRLLLGIFAMRHVLLVEVRFLSSDFWKGREREILGRTRMQPDSTVQQGGGGGRKRKEGGGRAIDHDIFEHGYFVP